LICCALQFAVAGAIALAAAEGLPKAQALKAVRAARLIVAVANCLGSMAGMPMIFMELFE
jgi:hypothetical protein